MKGVKIMKVEQFKNKNQFVIYGDNNEVTFQSYDSTIAIIEGGELTLGIDWDYSNTTLRHLYAFLEEYYYDFNAELKTFLYDLRNSSKKGDMIRKGIEKGLINYNENLR